MAKNIPLWQITTWDKNFNNVDKEWQPKTIKYKYLLSDELDSLRVDDGDIRILYTGKDVAVIGGGNTAVGDALYLSDLCHKVYLIHRQNSFRANTESLTNLKSKKNVHIITPAKVTKIIGEEAMGVFAVQVETNNSTIPNETLHKISDIPNETLSKTSDIPVSGVFVAVGRQPATDILQGIVPLNEQGYIVADENGRTSLDNFFAAGDVRSKENRQIITAAADGANAAISAEKYLTARI